MGVVLERAKVSTGVPGLDHVGTGVPQYDGHTEILSAKAKAKATPKSRGA